MNEDIRLEIVRRIDYIENLLPQSGIMPDAKARVEEHLRWIKEQVAVTREPKNPNCNIDHEGPCNVACGY